MHEQMGLLTGVDLFIRNRRAAERKAGLSALLAVFPEDHTEARRQELEKLESIYPTPTQTNTEAPEQTQSEI